MSSSDSSKCGDPYYAKMAELRKFHDWRIAMADSDWGVPKQCPCGGRIIQEVSPTETENKRYLTCVNYENDGLHRRKYWVHAIEEETQSLRETVDKHVERMREFGWHGHEISLLKEHLQAKDKEIATLKEEVDQIQAKDKEEIAKLKEEVASFEHRIRTLEHVCFD